MKYEDELQDRIKKTIGVDPTKESPTKIRLMLESLVDESRSMAFDHIGKEQVSEDVSVSSAEVNFVYRAQTVYDEFMEAYTKFLDYEKK